ncbi:MAG: glycosyltransferase [Prevotella sp.]|nr:glycosyltransferase [Prevotella sp.]
MIFARDKSQMCNNLLQYAHVYAWGREHGRKVISMRFSYKYQYFHICHTDLTGFGWYLLAKVLAALHILPTASFKDRHCDRLALEQQMLRHRHIVVSGWNVRYYDLFLKYRDDICRLFTIDACHTEPVCQQMRQAEQQAQQGDIVRLGLHIRRGDYDKWQGGRYFFSDEVYIRHINRFQLLHPGKEIHVYLATNDPSVSAEGYAVHCPNVHIHLLGGSPPADLFMLSACDFLIGPPSTFSLVAAMYRDLPLYRMDSADEQAMVPAAFRKFDYWFRRIL